jgi:hypothetical protein
MDNRKALRPTISTEPSESPAEKFQNEVLRPILKLQHTVLIQVFSQIMPPFKSKEWTEQKQQITDKIQKDPYLSALLSGVILGMMTPEELVEYGENTKEYARRMKSMLLQRILSHYQP